MRSELKSKRGLELRKMLTCMASNSVNENQQTDESQLQSLHLHGIIIPPSNCGHLIISDGIGSALKINSRFVQQ